MFNSAEARSVSGNGTGSGSGNESESGKGRSASGNERRRGKESGRGRGELDNNSNNVPDDCTDYSVSNYGITCNVSTIAMNLTLGPTQNADVVFGDLLTLICLSFSLCIYCLTCIKTYLCCN